VPGSQDQCCYVLGGGAGSPPSEVWTTPRAALPPQITVGEPRFEPAAWTKSMPTTCSLSSSTSLWPHRPPAHRPRRRRYAACGRPAGGGCSSRASGWLPTRRPLRSSLRRHPYDSCCRRRRVVRPHPARGRGAAARGARDAGQAHVPAAAALRLHRQRPSSSHLSQGSRLGPRGAARPADLTHGQEPAVAGAAPGCSVGAVVRQRRSKTMRALTWPFSTSSKHSLTSSSLRVSRITRVRPCAWIA
jgi:hypothetical protein